MDESHRLDGFKALLASHKKSVSYFEEPDGSRRLWRELSPEGKLGYIVQDAAYYNVPFEQFADAVRQSVDSAAIEEAALRLALRSGLELHELDKIIPDDRGTETTPLIERVSELLNAKSAGHDNEARPTAKEQTSLFKEMWEDYAAAKRADAHGCEKETYGRILDAKAQAPAPVTEKDKNIER